MEKSQQVDTKNHSFMNSSTRQMHTGRSGAANDVQNLHSRRMSGHLSDIEGDRSVNRNSSTGLAQTSYAERATQDSGQANRQL